MIAGGLARGMSDGANIRREDRSASTKRGNETRSLSFMSALGVNSGTRVSVRAGRSLYQILPPTVRSSSSSSSFLPIFGVASQNQLPHSQSPIGFICGRRQPCREGEVQPTKVVRPCSARSQNRGFPKTDHQKSSKFNEDDRTPLPPDLLSSQYYSSSYC
jgi:hypothetical protein